MKIVVFGGTFNPVHKLHLQIAQGVLDSGKADRILFIPAPNPPHKDSTGILPYEIRRKMLAAALAGNPAFVISDIERKREGKSYTFDTLEELCRLYPDDDIFLLIGSDSLRQLHTWYRARELVQRYPVLTWPREKEPVLRDELKEHWSDHETESLMNGFLRQMPASPVSSTEIRQAIMQNDREKLQEWLHPDVLTLIDSMGLYQKNTNQGDLYERK